LETLGDMNSGVVDGCKEEMTVVIVLLLVGKVMLRRWVIGCLSEMGVVSYLELRCCGNLGQQKKVHQAEREKKKGQVKFSI